MSPLICRQLKVSANLDGLFLINVNFCKRDEHHPLCEAKIIKQIQTDLDGIGVGKVAHAGNNNFNRRKNKQNYKNDTKSIIPKGAEQLI